MTIYQGITNFNGKKVFVSYMPGWGEPGQWLYQLDDGRRTTIEDPTEFGRDQYSYVKSILESPYIGSTSEIEIYIYDIFKANWMPTGNSDDVALHAMCYVEYNADNAFEDTRSYLTHKNEIKEKLSSVENFMDDENFSINGLNQKMNNIEQHIKKVTREVEAIMTRLRIFESLKNGETVGLNWTNTRFFENYGHTDEARRVFEIMEKYKNAPVASNMNS